MVAFPPKSSRHEGVFARRSRGENLEATFVYFSCRVTDMTGHLDSTANAVARSVIQSRGQFFDIDDFPDLPRGAVARSLSRLVEDGELRRVRRGVYWSGTKTPLGIAPPHPMAVLSHIYGPSAPVGPARLDAAGMLGLTSQVGALPTFAVPYLVEGLTMNLVNRERRRDRSTQGLNATEVALLEVLDGWDELVEVPMPTAISRIAEFIDGGGIRPERIAPGANSEPPANRELLRWILRSAKRTDAANVIRPAAREVSRMNALRSLGSLVNA